MNLFLIVSILGFSMVCNGVMPGTRQRSSDNDRISFPTDRGVERNNYQKWLEAKRREEQLRGRQVTGPNMPRVINDFSWRFLSTVYEEDKNIFFSPLSITSILGMLLLGANGATKREIEGLLRLRGNSQTLAQFENVTSYIKKKNLEKGLDINLSNLALFGNEYSINTQYLQSLQKVFQAKAGKVNFKLNQNLIKEKVNEYVKEATHNQIEEFLKEPLNSDTILYLLNAIYFKGNWQQRFDPKNTFKSKFLDSRNKEINVNMMYKSSDLRFKNVYKKGFQIVELPYEGNISMFIILPDEGVAALRDRPLVSLLTADLENDMQTVEEVKVKLSFPKFKVEEEIDLKSTLIKMNVNTLFDKRANLNGISNGLYVSKSQHKAVIEINEEGSIASAVSTSAFGVKSLPFVATFTVNRPFAFIIKDMKTSINLFMGVINTLPSV